MMRPGSLVGLLTDLLALTSGLSVQAVQFLTLCRKNEVAFKAEVFFLCKQLAYLLERKMHSRRFDNALRFLMVLLFAIAAELGSRKLLHVNTTADPAAAWIIEQLREAISSYHRYRFLLHDCDMIFVKALDASVKKLRLNIFKSPYLFPKANAICERFNGPLKLECMDFCIPLNESYLGQEMKGWKA